MVPQEPTQHPLVVMEALIPDMVNNPSVPLLVVLVALATIQLVQLQEVTAAQVTTQVPLLEVSAARVLVVPQLLEAMATLVFLRHITPLHMVVTMAAIKVDTAIRPVLATAKLQVPDMIQQQAVDMVRLLVLATVITMVHLPLQDLVTLARQLVCPTIHP